MNTKEYTAWMDATVAFRRAEASMLWAANNADEGTAQNAGTELAKAEITLIDAIDKLDDAIDADVKWTNRLVRWFKRK